MTPLADRTDGRWGAYGRGPSADYGRRRAVRHLDAQSLSDLRPTSAPTAGTTMATTGTISPQPLPHGVRAPVRRLLLPDQLRRHVGAPGARPCQCARAAAAARGACSCIRSPGGSAEDMRPAGPSLPAAAHRVALPHRVRAELHVPGRSLGAEPATATAPTRWPPPPGRATEGRHRAAGLAGEVERDRQAGRSPGPTSKSRPGTSSQPRRHDITRRRGRCGTPGRDRQARGRLSDGARQ